MITKGYAFESLDVKWSAIEPGFYAVVEQANGKPSRYPSKFRTLDQAALFAKSFIGKPHDVVMGLWNTYYPLLD